MFCPTRVCACADTIPHLQGFSIECACDGDVVPVFELTRRFLSKTRCCRRETREMYGALSTGLEGPSFELSIEFSRENCTEEDARTHFGEGCYTGNSLSRFNVKEKKKKHRRRMPARRHLSYFERVKKSKKKS